MKESVMKETWKVTIISVFAVLLGGAAADYVYDGQISRRMIYQVWGYTLRWVTFQVDEYVVIDGLTIYLNTSDGVITPALLVKGIWEPTETSLFLLTPA